MYMDGLPEGAVGYVSIRCELALERFGVIVTLWGDIGVEWPSLRLPRFLPLRTDIFGFVEMESLLFTQVWSGQILGA